MRGAERPALAPFIASPSGIRAAWTTRVGRPTRTPRRVVRWKSLELRILNDRGNTAVDRPRQADSRARPLRRRAEIMLRPARVRIRRRKPWVRLRRRLLGWNVRLLTGKLPNLRSGQQFRYGAHTARIAGGAGRWQRPLWKRPSNGTGHRQTGQTANPVKPLWFGPTRFGPRERADAILVADDLGDWGMSPASANIARRRGEQKRADTLSVRKQQPTRRLQKRYERADNKLAVNVQRTRRPGSRISQTWLQDVSAIASVAVRLSVFTQLPRPATFTRQPRCRRTVVSGSARRCIYAHSVDICVEAAEAVIPRVPTSQCEGADKSRFLLRVSGSRSETRRLRSHQ